jgi:large subunit ribosomal protein L25
VPGVVYGGGEDPIAFSVDSRLLRQALAHAGAVLELSIDGAGGTPVVLKELVRHPVTGETVHLDLLRVRLDQAITASVVVELLGAEDAPGVKEGGVLEQVTREVTIEALPNDIPDTIEHDVSEAVIGDTVTLEALAPPSGVTIVDDLETVLMTLTPPRLQLEEEPEIEEETERVGEDEGGEGEGEEAEEGSGEQGGDSEGESGE